MRVLDFVFLTRLRASGRPFIAYYGCVELFSRYLKLCSLLLCYYCHCLLLLLDIVTDPEVVFATALLLPLFCCCYSISATVFGLAHGILTVTALLLDLLFGLDRSLVGFDLSSILSVLEIAKDGTRMP